MGYLWPKGVCREPYPPPQSPQNQTLPWLLCNATISFFLPIRHLSTKFQVSYNKIVSYRMFLSTLISVESTMAIHTYIWLISGNGRIRRSHPGQVYRHQKHMFRHNVDEKFRLWENPNETIEHITNGCRMLAQREYTRRHNDVCGIIHRQIALDLGLLQDWKPYYRHVPVPVHEDELLLYWDRTIQTDHLVVHNPADIVLWDKRA